MTKIIRFFNACRFRLILWYHLRIMKSNFEKVVSMPHDKAKETITKWKWFITKSEADDKVKDGLYSSVTNLEKLIDENPEIGPLAAEIRSINKVFLLQLVLAIVAFTGMAIAGNYLETGWVVLSTAWCYSYCEARKTLANVKAILCQKERKENSSET